MPWNEAHKPRTRVRILQAAAGLFIQHGFKGVGIDAIMQHAGLTRGAFYAHFDSKSDLYSQAIRFAAQQGKARLERAREGRTSPIESYLSEAHLYQKEIACPLACLVSDVAQQDEQVRTTYTRLFEGFVAYQASATDTECPSRRRALQRAATMIGGMAIARTLTDERLARELLDACRELARSPAPEC